MAKQKYQLPDLQGLEEIRLILDLIRDADALAAALKQIDDAKAEAMAVIGRVGEVNQIETLRGEAELNALKSRNLLASAEASAADMKSRAEADIAADRAAFDADRAAWQRQVDERTGRLSDREREVSQREASVSQRETFAKNLQDEAERKMTAARALEAEVQQRADRLKAALS